MAGTIEQFHIASKRRFCMYLRSMGTLSAADDKDAVVIPFRAGRLVGVIMGVNTTGSTSGSTTIMIERHREESTVDNMITALSIANDAAVVHSAAIKDGINSDGTEDVLQGDLIMLNIDAVPGTASTDLGVTLIFHIDQE